MGFWEVVNPACDEKRASTTAYLANNSAILKSVEPLAQRYIGGGYDISLAFTYDLDYGRTDTIRASNLPRTMCVGAVTEVLITALGLYIGMTVDRSIFSTVPIRARHDGQLVGWLKLVIRIGFGHRFSVT